MSKEEVQLRAMPGAGGPATLGYSGWRMSTNRSLHRSVAGSVLSRTSTVRNPKGWVKVALSHVNEPGCWALGRRQ